MFEVSQKRQLWMNFCRALKWRTNSSIRVLSTLSVVCPLSDLISTSDQQNIKIVSTDSGIDNRGLESNDTSKHLESEFLMIPRRPKWHDSTTPEELNQLEYNSYLEWRRGLARLQENSDVVVTPFEKNIEFWRQLWRVVERSDVCVQILDGRNPLLFLSPDLQKYVKEVDENKVNVILLNKSDFLDECQRTVWAQYFDSIGVRAVFFSAKQQLEIESPSEDSQIASIGECQTNSNRILSREELIDFFKSLKRETTSYPLTIGLVGYPNVGKSSTINAILQAKRVSVSATPGKTKHFQTLVVDSELTLCDCPGLVFPKIVSSKAEMIVNGILPIDQLKEPIAPMSLLTQRIPMHIFESIYSIVLSKSSQAEEDIKFTTAEELLTAYGYSRGFMTQRGIPDICRSARYILKDFVCGKILYCFGPPNADQNSFHVFPPNENHSNIQMCESLKRILVSNQIIGKNSKDFDDLYFTDKSSMIHSKGVFGVSGYTRKASDSVRHCGSSQTSQTSTDGDPKPWKRHNNRKKKEKLRRVYAHLDQ